MAFLDLIPADANNFPFIASIETTFPTPIPPGSLEVGTGTLIAPRVVLTAAHVVFDRERGGKAVSIDISFGGALRLLTVPSVTEVDFPMEWRQAATGSFDLSTLSPVDVAVII